MKELLGLTMRQKEAEVCPAWCLNAGFPASAADALGAPHLHVSADVAAGAPEQPLVARLVGRAADDSPAVLLNGCVATVEQVEAFLDGMRMLLDSVRPALVAH